MPAPNQARFGTELIESLEFDPEQSVFVTMELPWVLITSRLHSRPSHVEFVQSMERTILDKAAETLPPIDTVIGVGGGSALDFATGYLRHVLSFMGINDLQFIRADRTAIDHDATLAAAEAEIDNLPLAA